MNLKHRKCEGKCLECAFHCKGMCMFRLSRHVMFGNNSDSDIVPVRSNDEKCRYMIPKEMIAILQNSNSYEETAMMCDLIGWGAEFRKNKWIEWNNVFQKYATSKMMDCMKMIAGKYTYSNGIEIPPISICVSTIAGDTCITPFELSRNFYSVSRYISENLGLVDTREKSFAKYMI